MKRIITGIALAGATLYTAGGAGAEPDASGIVIGDSDGWTYTYDFNAAELVQSPARSQFAWEVPATFTNDKTGEVLNGFDFWRDSDNQANSVFIDSDTGAYYATDHDPLPFPQWTPSIFFSPNGYDNLTGSNGKLGDATVGQGLSWMLRPADYRDPVTFGDALDKSESNFGSVLNVGESTGASDTWTANLTGEHDVIGFMNLPMWSGDVTYTDAAGQSISGTDYMWAPFTLGTYDQEFVTDDGATYAYTPGILGFDNMYYDPGNGGDITDILKTPLGDVDLSWASWLFTPPDYSDAAVAMPDASPFDGDDLTDAFNFADTLNDAAGSSAADMASAFDPSDLIG